MRSDTFAELAETVETCRAQAAVDPSRLPDLATALTALGVAHHNHADYPDAVALVEEAVETWRRVDGRQFELVAALTILSSYYRLIGLDEEADAVTEEAQVTRLARE
jgi:hypothetical protein